MVSGSIVFDAVVAFFGQSLTFTIKLRDVDTLLIAWPNLRIAHTASAFWRETWAAITAQLRTEETASLETNPATAATAAALFVDVFFQNAAAPFDVD